MNEKKGRNNSFLFVYELFHAETKKKKKLRLFFM